MKWINHQVVTGVAVYTATSDLLLTAYSMAGALLPDKLEGNPRAGNYWAWRSRHRGWSHWPVLYLALLGISLHFGNGDYGFEGGELATIGKFFAIGALLHIAEDMTCGKVPIVTPNRKHGARLYAVGSVFEYLFAIAIVLLCYVSKMVAGG